MIAANVLPIIRNHAGTDAFIAFDLVGQHHLTSAPVN